MQLSQSLFRGSNTESERAFPNKLHSVFSSRRCSRETVAVVPLPGLPDGLSIYMIASGDQHIIKLSSISFIIYKISTSFAEHTSETARKNRRHAILLNRNWKYYTGRRQDMAILQGGRIHKKWAGKRRLFRWVGT
jgi:hypothetical protein